MSDSTPVPEFEDHSSEEPRPRKLVDAGMSPGGFPVVAFEGSSVTVPRSFFKEFRDADRAQREFVVTFTVVSVDEDEDAT